MDETILPIVGFTEARNELSDLMSDVVQHHHPRLVDRRGKEQMLLVSPEQALEVLAHFRFDPQVSFSDGEFVVSLPQLQLVAGGEDLDEALDELVELVEHYAGDFFDRYEFFQHTDRRQHYPWLLRFALTPPDHRRELLTEAPAAAPNQAPQLA
jgi:hypothetical protein